MSLFSKILEKLGLRKEKEEEQPAAKGTTGTTGTMPSKPAATTPNPKTTTAGKPAGAAPTSQKGVSTTPGVGDQRQKDNVAVRQAPAPCPPRQKPCQRWM